MASVEVYRAISTAMVTSLPLCQAASTRKVSHLSLCPGSARPTTMTFPPAWTASLRQARADSGLSATTQPGHSSHRPFYRTAAPDRAG
jgi:hypothetical protein